MIKSRVTPAQVAYARRWLAHEGASGGSAGECAAAAVRVYDKLNSQLVPLLGAAGVEALFARSAKLAHNERPRGAQVVELGSATSLAAGLRELEPAAAAATAEALFGTFLALIATFIGDRLTLQVLHRAWPTIEEPPSLTETPASPENKK